MVNRPFFGKETQQLLNAVDLFAEKMKQRLIVKSTEGYTGWQELTTPDIIAAVEERLPRLLAGEDVEVGIANWLLINFVNNKSYQNVETRVKGTNVPADRTGISGVTRKSKRTYRSKKGSTASKGSKGNSIKGVGRTKKQSKGGARLFIE